MAYKLGEEFDSANEKLDIFQANEQGIFPCDVCEVFTEIPVLERNMGICNGCLEDLEEDIDLDDDEEDEYEIEKDDDDDDEEDSELFPDDDDEFEIDEDEEAELNE